MKWLAGAGSCARLLRGGRHTKTSLAHRHGYPISSVKRALARAEV